MARGIRIPLEKLAQVEGKIEDANLSCLSCHRKVKVYLTKSLFSKNCRTVRFRCPVCGNLRPEDIVGSMEFLINIT